MRSKPLKPVEKRNIDFYEDKDGNVCIQATQSDFLELIHKIMSAVTNSKTTVVELTTRKVYINIKKE